MCALFAVTGEETVLCRAAADDPDRPVLFSNADRMFALLRPVSERADA